MTHAIMTYAPPRAHVTCVWVTCVCYIISASVAGVVRETRDAFSDDRVEWQTFGGRQYLFLLDAQMRAARTRDEAQRDCYNRQASLVSLETEAELVFIQDSIQRLVKGIGEEFATEQWWTSGKSHRGFWIWENKDRSTVGTTAMKRKTVPKHGAHYLALCFIYNNWRFKVTPDNYRLRYICERPVDRLQVLPSLPNRDVDNVTQDLGTQEELRRFLFMRYDRSSPAEQQTGDTLLVKLGMRVTSILHQADDPVFTIITEVSVTWPDFRLSWAPSLYSGLPQTTLAVRAVWAPQVFLLSGLDNDRPLWPRLDDELTLSHTGYAQWTGRLVVRTPCAERARRFPFDTCMCTLQFGLGELHDFSIAFSANVNVTEDVDGRPGWRLGSVSSAEASRLFSPPEARHATTLAVHVRLQRRHLQDAIVALVPCAVLCVSLSIVLLVVRAARDRMVGLLGCVLGCLVYLVGLRVPPSAPDMPVIVLYTLFLLALSLMAAMVTAILSRCAVRRYRRAPPLWLARCLNTTGHKHDKLWASPAPPAAPKRHPERAHNSLRHIKLPQEDDTISSDFHNGCGEDLELKSASQCSLPSVSKHSALINRHGTTSSCASTSADKYTTSGSGGGGSLPRGRELITEETALMRVHRSQKEFQSTQIQWERTLRQMDNLISNIFAVLLLAGTLIHVLLAVTT